MTQTATNRPTPPSLEQRLQAMAMLADTAPTDAMREWWLAAAKTLQDNAPTPAVVAQVMATIVPSPGAL